jgi:hypothetical protein
VVFDWLFIGFIFDILVEIVIGILTDTGFGFFWWMIGIGRNWFIGLGGSDIFASKDIVYLIFS